MPNRQKPGAPDACQAKSVAIIGFGRFGKLLSQLLSDKFDVLVYDNRPQVTQNLPENKTIKLHTSIDAIVKCNTIFIAVPIHQFATTIHMIAEKLQANTTVIDVCSVKIYPVKIMRNILPAETNIIATHPLFGPDSINNPAARRIMMHRERSTDAIYQFWKNFFERHNITVLEMTPAQHDELAARSQSITHFIGRVLDDAELETTGMDTKGFHDLLNLKQQTCNDSWELFYDLQQYNPYSKQYLERLLKSIQRIKNKIMEHTQSNDHNE